MPLHIDLKGHPATLSLSEITLRRKTEVHPTLLSTREAELLASRVSEAEWQNAFDGEQWEIRLLDEFELLREERASEAARFSVIRHVDCPSLNAFRKRLAQASGLALAATLPHVTLYTAGHERGIGLSSQADYERFRVRTLTPTEGP